MKSAKKNAPTAAEIVSGEKRFTQDLGSAGNSTSRRINAVFFDGRFLSKEKLAAMLEKVDKDFNY